MKKEDISVERVTENLNKNISRPLSVIKGRKFHGKSQDVYIFQLKCIKAEYVNNSVMCDLEGGGGSPLVTYIVFHMADHFTKNSTKY